MSAVLLCFVSSFLVVASCRALQYLSPYQGPGNDSCSSTDPPSSDVGSEKYSHRVCYSATLTGSSTAGNSKSETSALTGGAVNSFGF
ncbi:hypothetical protein B0H14DRAFT_976386 [Mycena olivaceomarginata]|nr:hypothetical protein B0H14DRAFT_976386 [Mycena olivaceomarginata]